MLETTRPSVYTARRQAAGDARSAVEVARSVLLDHLGVDRVAAWCGVPTNTVYVWLRRGSEDEPIPLRRALTIFEASREAGIHFDIRMLAPAIPAGRV